MRSIAEYLVAALTNIRKQACAGIHPPQQFLLTANLAEVYLHLPTSIVINQEITFTSGSCKTVILLTVINDYALVGGGFPIRLKSGELVAVAVVSAFPHYEDHQFIVDALAEYLGIDDVPSVLEFYK